MSVCTLTNRTTSWRDTWTFTARHKKTIDGCVVVIKTQNDVITDQTEDIQLRDTVSVCGTSVR